MIVVEIPLGQIPRVLRRPRFRVRSQGHFERFGRFSKAASVMMLRLKVPPRIWISQKVSVFSWLV